MTTLDTKHDLMKEPKLDLAYTRYIFFRESPENNSKVKTDSTTTNTSQYSKTCFVAVPNQEEYCKKDGNLDEPKIVADMMTSYSESLSEKKSSEEVFSKWNPRSDSNTETPNCYLDQIVTDESVTDILYTYLFQIPFLGLEYMTIWKVKGWMFFLVEDKKRCMFLLCPDA